ncbi:DNA replication protein psf1 [Exophiala oligosperma]
MYGDIGTKLAQHAKRTLTLPTLPPYQTELVRGCVRETRDLDRDVTRLLEPYTTTVSTVDEDGNPTSTQQSTFNPVDHPETACALLVDHLSMRRNKRCLLAYHRVRAEKLESLAWEGRDIDEHQQQQDPMRAGGAGDQGGGGGGSSSQQNALSPEEESYFRKYTDLLAQYKGQWTDVDLTGTLDPPRDLFIDVRVLKDAGEIQTEYGAINLTKNSQFYVRQADVERLIAMGFLQRLS